MPSFADIKAKAIKAKDVGVEKIQQTKDRNTSIPMKKTNWDPYSGKPPPPLAPVRSNTRSRPELAPLPPPPSRTGSTTSSVLPGPSAPSTTAPPPPIPRRTTSSSASLSSGPPRLPSRVPSTSSTSSSPAPPPPPPFPSRSSTTNPSTSSSSGGPPPPIARSTRPNPQSGATSPPPVPASRAFPAPSPIPPQRKSNNPFTSNLGTTAADSRFEQQAHVDWVNLSQEDKQVFFSWLDEYFSRLLNITILA
ncbi:hypothetical protein AX17_003032 [Amanita inopinata Kibby_2008]|nr:hypothetical protein AX17_003032 [Amanita inopinata Kibby_2008]